MTTRSRRVDHAVALAEDMSTAARKEFRLARISAGLSRADVGRAAGISASQVDRYERGQLRDVRIEQVCRLSLAVGLVPVLRFNPDADPFRDVAHVRLLGRARARMSPTLRWRTEVPLMGQTDRRAWDAVVDGHGCTDAFEAETRLADIQAIDRRIMRKFRDDQSVQHVMLVVSDTRANRDAIAVARDALRGNFPVDSRAALASLSLGRCPGANALIVL